MSQALYRKWRPQIFADVIGQEHITTTLQNSVAADRVGHAYLFCGPRGTGKTTSARLLAKAVNCLAEDAANRPCNQCSICTAVTDGRFLDLIEIDAASNTGVDDMRDLRDKINFQPSEGRFKVYIIDEVHMLSTAAFNALLKTLEEPPPHVKFILATTEEHKVPITIKSRCQQFNFRLLTEAEISGRLQWMSEREDFTLEAEALAIIARQGAGSMRDAESLLDQLLVSPGDTITVERTQMVLGVASNTAVINLTAAWVDGNGAVGLEIIHAALGAGADARQFSRQMVAYLRQILLLQAAGTAVTLEITQEEMADMMAQAERAPRQGLIEAIKGFNEAATTQSSSWQPQLPLELAFIELLPTEALPPVPVTMPKTAVPVPEPKAKPVAKVKQPQTEDKVAEPETAVVAPPAQPKSQTEPLSPSTDTPITLQMITNHWRDLVNRAGEDNKNMPALLNMGKPLAIEGNTIVVGFDYPIFKEKFDNTVGATQLLGEIASNLLACKCNIRVVVTSDYTVPINREDFQALADEVGGVVSE